MAERQFISNNPEQILSDTISQYQNISGNRLNPADAERIIIDCMVYREMIFRSEAEYLMRQNFVQYASGDNLNAWGELFGVTRISSETDDDYRKRIIAAAKGSIGTYDAYKQRILSLPDVADIKIYRKYEDNTLPPGMIKLIPIMKVMNDTDMITYGTVHNEILETEILKNINTSDFGIIGALFSFGKAIPVTISGSISIKGVVNYPIVELKKNVVRKIEEYFAGLSLSYGSSFGVFDLERAILDADGVLTGGVSLSFLNVPILSGNQFYIKGNVDITYR